MAEHLEEQDFPIGEEVFQHTEEELDDECTSYCYVKHLLRKLIKLLFG